MYIYNENIYLFNLQSVMSTESMKITCIQYDVLDSWYAYDDKQLMI